MATPYTPVLIWANTAGKDGYVHEKSDIKSGLISGVMSMWAQDIENYDNTEYRDTPFDLAAIIATAPGVAYAPLTNVGAEEYLTEGGATTDPQVTTTVPSGAVSTNDEALHIPPRPTLHKRTLLQLWDDAAGTGNLLYACWADRFISFEVSTTAPTFIQ